MAFSAATGSGRSSASSPLVVIVALLIALGRSDSRVVRGGASGWSSAARSATCSTGCSAAPGWLRGAVVDFIDLQWWPIFNVADMAITVGGVLLIVSRCSVDRASSGDAVRTVHRRRRRVAPAP